MVERYFEKLPIIQYSNNQIVDITKRTALLERVSSNPYVFYPYDISDEERADQLSNNYYGDPFQSWLLYISNKIIDPYYEWYLSMQELDEFIEKKYGSLYGAQQKIKHYVNNWNTGDNLTISGFDALPGSMKKYWEPVYGIGDRIINYKRKEIDWTLSTNKLVSYELGSANSSNFTFNEICHVYFDNNTTGRGQVVATSNTHIYLQHVSGIYDANTDSGAVVSNGVSYLYGSESGTNSFFVGVDLISNTTNDEEYAYYKPVTYYDYEFNRNEYNKSVRIMDKDLAQVASDNLRDLMKE